MNNQIGETAGEIWRLLNQEGELSFARIKKSLGQKESLVYMALGWLAREEQICIREVDGRTVKYSVHSE